MSGDSDLAKDACQPQKQETAKEDTQNKALTETIGLMMAIFKQLFFLMFIVDLAYSQGRCTKQENQNMMTRCINPYASDKTPCSGHGDCVCGVCECHPKSSNSPHTYSGQYCDCDDYSCSYHEAKMCGGRGTCNCGHCDCNQGYTGKACECPTFNTTCLASNNKVCNDEGNCVCGVCKCSSWSSYKGPTCEECPTCPGRCQKYKACALCKGFQAGEYDKEECNRRCLHFSVEESIDKEKAKDNDLVVLCQFQDDDDCTFLFSYEYMAFNRVKVAVQSVKECPSSNSTASVQHHNHFLGVAMGVLSATILHRLV